jgi:hypothetical protein
VRVDVVGLLLNSFAQVLFSPRDVVALEFGLGATGFVGGFAGIGKGQGGQKENQ